MDIQPWLITTHVLAAFAFFALHGVSMAVWWRLRTERDRARVASYLELSASMLVVMSVAGLALIVTGILAGIVGAWWFNGQWWLWLSIGILVVIVGAMTPLMAIPMAEAREAVGLPTAAQAKAGTIPVPLDDAELDRRLRNPRPTYGATIGIVGIVLITWLMEMKPF